MRGFVRKFKPLDIVTEGQIEAIHRGTLDVLERTGLRIEHKGALKLLEKNGCRVEHDNNRVRFPPGLVEECLRKCPSSFRVKARNPKNDFIYGGDVCVFTTFPGMQTIDLDTWEARKATKKEYYDGVTILDALDNLHCHAAYTPYFGYEGISPVMCIPEGFAARVRNSSKATREGFSNDSEIFTIEMAKAVGSDVIHCIGASAPLTYYENSVEALFRCVETDLPILVGSGDIMGGSAPVTIAGESTTVNAEILGGIVMAQLAKPGAKIQAGNVVYPQNMRSGTPVFGAIENALSNALFCQYFRTLGIPRGANNISVNSKRSDIQCGYEKGILGILAAVCGANVASFHGGIFGELTFHPVQAILDDDISGMIGRFLEGVQVNEDTMAVDLINEVGPIPGFYLDKEHTRTWWRREHFLPKVADRLSLPEWMENGKKSALDYAKSKMEEILTSHKTEPLTAGQENEVERILLEARKFYRKKGLLTPA